MALTARAHDVRAAGSEGSSTGSVEAAHRSTGAASRGRGAGDRSRTPHPGRVAINVEAGDQIFITGINGSGKSRLANQIANALTRVLVYEPKGDDPEVRLPNAAVCWGAEAALKALPGRVIYHPTAAEISSIGKHFDRLVQKILATGGRHGIVIHETCDLGNASRGFETFLSMAVRQGRSRGITRVFVTQRPVADVPRLAVSEAKHFVAFYLQDERDRRTLASYMGPEVVPRVPFDHDYWYCGKASGMRCVRMGAL